MAKSSKQAGSPLLPIAIIAVVVIAVIAGIFTLTGSEPPEQATIIPEDVSAEPAGAGTAPEGEADEVNEGVTDQLDSVEPVAPDETQIPAADMEINPSPDEGTEGETDADEQVTGAVNNPVVMGTEGETGSGGAGGASDTTAGATETGEVGAGGADGELGDEPGMGETQEDADEDAADQFLLDESSDDAVAGTPETTVPSDGEADTPAGRDADTALDPEPGQDVVRDTDEGGAAFVPTPSGPAGRDNKALTTE